MRILYIGNFEPEHSTENHVAQAIRSLGHDLQCIQENNVESWRLLAAGQDLAEHDMVAWTRTGWTWPDYGISVDHMDQLQHQFLRAAESLGVPTVGYHLDKWVGLPRQHEIYTEPFFRSSVVVTADGGHPDVWKAAGINHRWLPPGVSEFECVGGNFDPQYASDLAFVGSWQGYHPEHQHRSQLVSWLQNTQGGRVQFWPKPGEHAVRGVPLRDLYASTKINVGDSCLIPGTSVYFSDRCPETMGRGGFLLHPWVEGVFDGTCYEDGVHLVTWQMGDWDRLQWLIDYYLEHEDERKTIAAAGQEHTLAHHTYTTRIKQLIDIAEGRTTQYD